MKSFWGSIGKSIWACKVDCMLFCRMELSEPRSCGNKASIRVWTRIIASHLDPSAPVSQSLLFIGVDLGESVG